MFKTEIFKVGDWLIEPELLRISKNNEVRNIEYMVMKVLLCLVSNKGNVVSKQQLQDEVWKDVIVSENTITRSISKLRKAFSDNSSDPQFIKTISKSGYRLIAPVDLENKQNGEFDLKAEVKPEKEQSVNWYWIAMSVIAMLVATIYLSGTKNKDMYSVFYDPKPVSTLLGPERGLSISPDGKKISFSYQEPGTNNVDVYVKLLDDLSQQKFTDLESQQGYGTWSPDGIYMAYVSTEDGNCGIYKEPSFGGEKTRIGNCYQSPQDFVWSPDGKTMAFTDIKIDENIRRIFLLDINNHESSALFPLEDEVTDRDPVFSPDKEHIFFRRSIDSQGQNIYKFHLLDKKLTQLTFDSPRMLGLDLFDEGRQIAFSSDRSGTWALWKLNLANQDITRFYINDRIPTDPKFSANGNTMVYRSLRDQTRIWAVEKNETGYDAPVHMASSSRSEIQAKLSRDGQKVVFISDRSGFFEIWIQDIDGSNVRKLTSLEGKVLNMPSIDNDNSEVIFNARIDGDNKIYLLDVASKSIRTFVELNGDQVNASYSRDGKSIYFASNHTGTWQIWNKPIFDHTQNIVQITTDGGYYLQEGITDQYLYYSRFDTPGVWRLDKNLDSKEELFIEDLSDYDWGNWVPVMDGVIYIKRSPEIQLYKQPYDNKMLSIFLAQPHKRIQSWTSSLSANNDGSKITYVQIENSEDEIMMVDFK